MALRVDRFWLVVGMLFVVGGIWNLFNVRIDLLPIVFIAAGIALLASTLSRRAAREH
jgi:hypothetical protein